MDVLIPEGMPVIWTEGQGFVNTGSENGVLAGGAVGYYVHSAQKDYYNNGTTFKWRLVVEMIPAEAVPELDNLSGTQYNPSIYHPNALIEGGIVPQEYIEGLQSGQTQASPPDASGTNGGIF